MIIAASMTGKLYKFVNMDPGPVKIFTTSDVPRLRYIADVILREILGLSWEVVTDKRKLGKSPVINYSNENISGSFKIIPDSLLFETGIRNHETVTEWKGLPVFFQTPALSDLPFDIFAASFFMITRYEEYLGFESDEFGRFKASSSIALKNGFLLRPVIDLWAKELAKSLITRFQNLAFRRNVYKSLLTIDVDEPFAYLGKDIFRCVGGLLKDLSKRSGKAGARYRTVAKGEKDPYDVFDYIFDSADKINTEARFFIPVGDHSAYDKNPSWQNDDYRKLIAKISNKFITGLHPSFVASGNLSSLQTEINRLKSILSKDILSSRSHFIRIRFPDYYKNLAKSGITEDYSMGYPDEPGFRAGIARPFFFYDVSEERRTELKIIPFQVMDGTLIHYKKLDPGASDEIIARLIDETRKAGGLFVSIWHNTSLLDNPEKKGWRESFENMLKLQRS
jgi:hypothetical protein